MALSTWPSDHIRRTYSGASRNIIVAEIRILDNYCGLIVTTPIKLQLLVSDFYLRLGHRRRVGDATGACYNVLALDSTQPHRARRLGNTLQGLVVLNEYIPPVFLQSMGLF